MNSMSSTGVYSCYQTLIQSKFSSWQDVCSVTETLIATYKDYPNFIKSTLTWGGKLLTEYADFYGEKSLAEEKLKGIVACCMLKKMNLKFDHVAQQNFEMMWDNVPSMEGWETVEGRMQKFAAAIDEFVEENLLSYLPDAASIQISQPVFNNNNRPSSYKRGWLEHIAYQRDLQMYKERPEMGGSTMESSDFLIKKFRITTLAIIKQNDVYILLKKTIKQIDLQTSIEREIELRIEKIAPKIQKAVEELENTFRLNSSNLGKRSREARDMPQLIKVGTSEVKLTDGIVNEFKAYYCYHEALMIDNEKWASQLGIKLEEVFKEVDASWKKGQWPENLGPFIEWKKRRGVQKFNETGLKKILDSFKDQQVLVSTQLCLNYWLDAYMLCLTLQKREESREIGIRMEMELFFLERKAILLKNNLEKRNGGTDFFQDLNESRLPQPMKVINAGK